MSSGSERMRVFFDISSLVSYVSKIDRYSGIQRVLVNIIRELGNRASDAEFYLCFHEGVGKKYVCVSFDDFDVANFDDPRALRGALNIGKSKSAADIDVISKYKSSAAKYYFHRTRLDILAFLGSKSSFLRYNITPERWLEMRFPKDGKARRDTVRKSFLAMCRPGDALVNLDSSWLPLHERTFSAAKEKGVICYTLVYDLIPILLPQTTHGMMPLIFHKWLANSVEYTSKYLCISNATKKDLQDFLARYGFEREVEVLSLVQQGIDKKISPIALGPMSTRVNKDAYPWLYEVAEISDDIRNVATVPYVLCAGTIEARKNVWRIAQSWQRLLQEGNYDLPRLVFAGRKGWHIEAFENFLKGSGNLGGWIQVVEAPSDAELAFLYRNCKFSIMASLYEGWGLPVGEALSYGKTAVVANNSSLPEVGGEYVEYCDAASIESIAAACRRLIRGPQRLQELEKSISTAKMRNWEEVCSDLLNILGLSGKSVN
ncbi:glycosyltransferase family 4 protein [Agrobacterium tumefaciens]|nr:glycosyltransferase family 4 protein [Agrobacterium tumefaciens]